MLTDDYTVRLDSFQGPLDLLLYLARKAEVEITDIPIAQIADQYVEHLKGIDQIDIDLAGEFLVMAATLMELKSRLLMPAPSDEDEDRGETADESAPDEPTDLRAELISQLLAYKEIRDASDALEQRREVWRRRFPSARAATDRAALREAAEKRSAEVELDDLNLFDIVEAYERIVEQVNFDLLGAHHVEMDEDDTPVELHAEDLVDQLSRAASPMPLLDVFKGRTRGQMVGLFVAALELVRQRRISIEQRDDDGEVVLTLHAEGEGQVDGDDA